MATYFWFVEIIGANPSGFADDVPFLRFHQKKIHKFVNLENMIYPAEFFGGEKIAAAPTQAFSRKQTTR